MDEAFDLQVLGRLGADLRDLVERDLARHHHARRAHVVERGRGGVVGHARLGGHVALDVGGVLLRHLKHAQIGHDHRVGPDALQKLQKFQLLH